MCRYGNVGMCTKSVYQCPLHEVVWDIGDVAAKSHFCVAPRERRMSPAPERAELSSGQHSGSYHSGCLWSPNTQCYSSSVCASSPAALLAHCGFPLLSWRLCLEHSGTGRSGRCVCAKPLAPVKCNYHWSGRSRAVCFEFSFSRQYCYLPNPLTLQSSSGCFKHLNGFDWNPKLSTDECYLPPVFPITLILEPKQQQ